MTDSLITDRIVSGTKDITVKDRLLREADLDLTKCMDICRAAEFATKQIKTVEKVTLEVDQDQLRRRPFHSKFQSSRGSQDYSRHQENKRSGFIFKCTRCSYNHKINNCPARGKKCENCVKINHFKKCCLSKNKINVINKINDTNQSVERDNENENLYIGTLRNMDSVNDDWSVDFLLNDKLTVSLKLDTGADCNVLPLNIVKELKINLNELNKYKGNVIGYSGK